MKFRLPLLHLRAANGVGLTPWQTLYADILFTQKSVAWDDRLSLPGLGLSLIRYNIGGGSATDQEGEVLPLPSNPSRQAAVDYDFWKHRYKKIEGFQVFPPKPESPAQAVYDWQRDARQRSILKLAQARGVTHIEFFSDSPMCR